MRIRRCGILLIEPREKVEFQFESLLTGGDGLATNRNWIALAPHLDDEVVLASEEIAPLGGLAVEEWTEFDDAASRFDPAVLRSLLAKGLVLADDADGDGFRARDDALRATHWHAFSAVTHAFGRWRNVDSAEITRQESTARLSDLVARLGDPPTHFLERATAAERVALPRAQSTALDDLLRQRAVSRNFDTTRLVPLATVAQILHRVLGAQAVQAVTANTAIVKKTSPSAGGLHPTEAYVLIQGVEQLANGLYHYHAGEHALEPLRALDDASVRQLALDFLAQQDWFAPAQVIVILAVRVDRTFWKYRNHSKVYRAVTLDVGHLSQTLQISATEFGLGAFVTSAINEVDIERELGLDPMRECPLAICGFGWRGAERVNVELDPLHAVWKDT